MNSVKKQYGVTLPIVWQMAASLLRRSQQANPKLNSGLLMKSGQGLTVANYVTD